MPVYRSTGITVEFAGLTGEILDINPGGEEAEEVDVTHQGSTDDWAETIPGSKDAGEVSLTMHWENDASPALGAEDTLVITHPTGGELVNCDAWVKKRRELDATFKSKIVETVTFRLTGVPD